MLYALDAAWWKQYLREVRQVFTGALVTPQRVPGTHREQAWLGREQSNSGAAALAQAAWWCVERVVMLGYDLAFDPGGRRHWHGDHPGELGNADGVADWPAQFAAILPLLRGIEVINASRVTALTCFPRMPLEDALA